MNLHGYYPDPTNRVDFSRVHEGLIAETELAVAPSA
jgi:hypothetical protein